MGETTDHYFFWRFVVFVLAKLKCEQNKYEISVDEHASFDVYNLSIIQ